MNVILSDPPADRSRFSVIGLPLPSPPMNFENTFFSLASRDTSSDQSLERKSELALLSKP